jgi:hypothetical protein
VRLLIDGAHNGNVHEASKVSGVPSATLRALYSGKNINPELKTLETLAQRYGVLPGWFSDPNALGFVPPTGMSLIVRERTKKGNLEDLGWLFIPWASWPLPGVYWRLHEYVTSLPLSAKRPIIGELDHENPTDAIEVRAKVAAFLLAPLESIESVFPTTLSERTNPMDPAMIRRKRMLGIFWQDALRDILVT